MITLESLIKKYSDKTIIDQLSLEVEAGERIAIIGESGCGKSTLLRMLLGITKPDRGQVIVNGQNLNKLSYRQLRKLRLNIGMLFQSGALFDSMTVFENVGFSLSENYFLKGEELSEKVAECLEMVEMTGYESRMPSELSGGQRKRIGLARAIATNPGIMLYDEPTTGLDPVLSTNIEDLIVKLNKRLNITSIIVSHQQSTILRTVDKIYMMNEGKLLPFETPKTIMKTKEPIIRHFMSGGMSH